MPITNESEQLENFKIDLKRDLKSLLEKYDAPLGYEWGHAITKPYDAYMDVPFDNGKSVELVDEHSVDKDNI